MNGEDRGLLLAHLRAIRAAIVAVALAVLTLPFALGGIGPIALVLSLATAAFVAYAIAPSEFDSSGS